MAIVPDIFPGEFAKLSPVYKLWLALQDEQPGQLLIVPAAEALSYRTKDETVAKLFPDLHGYNYDNPEDTYFTCCATLALLVLAAEGEL